jgi:probable rRNA maturation factor
MSSGVETSLAVLIVDSSTTLSLGMTKSRIDLKSNPKSVASPRISVRNLQRTLPVNAAELQQFAVRVLHRCLQSRKRKRTDLRRLRNVFVWIISDRRMSRLHREFLGKTGPTDVLTFQHGEIFISAEMAKRHARAFGNSLLRELQLYIVHGLLHLHGFNDRTQPGARTMDKMQAKIMSQCGSTAC